MGRAIITLLSMIIATLTIIVPGYAHDNDDSIVFREEPVRILIHSGSWAVMQPSMKALFTPHLAQITVGQNHVCIRASGGSFACWGDDSFMQSTPPDDVHFLASIHADAKHTCGLDFHGQAICWGDTDTQISPPPTRFLHISIGRSFICGLRTNRSVQCWGNNRYQQATPPREKFIAISAGGSHACAITPDARAICWGKNNYGQTRPPRVSFREVASGENHNCAIRSDNQRVMCWGANHAGQSAPPDLRFTTLRASDSFTCGLDIGGQIHCWGDPFDGLLSIPQFPVTFRTLDVGPQRVCAISTTDHIACWPQARE